MLCKPAGSERTCSERPARCACSAALVACHAGLRALQRNECTLSLIEGVNLMLLPTANMAFAVAGMTSARGRSHTFDVRADGYGRGEALVAVVKDTIGFDDEHIYQQLPLPVEERDIPMVQAMRSEGLVPFTEWSQKLDRTPY